MKIGIDCRTITSQPTGIGHYTYYLVKNLLTLDKKNKYFLFFNKDYPNAEEFKKRNSEIIYLAKKKLPYVDSHLLVARAINKHKLDLCHFPANAMPLAHRGKSVVTVHDLAIYEHPEWFPEKQGFSTKVVVPKSLNKADEIIAVSKSTQKSIKKLFSLDSQVIYEGFDKDKEVSEQTIKRIKNKFGIKDKFVFYVGTIEPRKNIARAIKAFDNLNPKGYQLVIAGGKGWNYEDVFQAIKNSKSGRIKYLNYISHQEKIALLQSAQCFVFPSLWEGFGLPVLEAMSLGTPVITSNISALPEVVGEAALLVDPKKISSFEGALKKLINSDKLQAELSKKGKIQSKKFSWKKCAKETLKVYNKIS